MTLNAQEAMQLKTDVEILKASTNQVITALGESTEAQKENTKLIHSLLIEMRERDVRDEYKAKEIDEIKVSIKLTDKSLTRYIEDNKEPLSKLNKHYKRKDQFISGITSTWGKIAAGAILIGAAYVLGFDLTKILK
jgi:hypothetical protein